MLTFCADVTVSERHANTKPAYRCGERDKYCRATKFCILTFWNTIHHFHNLSQNKTMMGRKRKLQSGSSVPQADNHSWGRWLAIVAMVACLALPCSEAFSLTMEYKPPVKIICEPHSKQPSITCFYFAQIRLRWGLGTSFPANATLF